MKPHTEESRVAWSNFAESQRGDNDPESFELNSETVFFTVVHIPDNQKPFPYAVAAAVPPNQEAYTIAVSDDVPEQLRGLWAWHELHDFKKVGHAQEGRCLQTEEELALHMNSNSPEYQEYLRYRIHFYTHLEKFIAEDLAQKGESSEYDSFDVDGCRQAVQFLRSLREDKSSA